MVSTLSSRSLSLVEYSTLDGSNLVCDVLTSWPTATPEQSACYHPTNLLRVAAFPRQWGLGASLLFGTKHTYAATGLKIGYRGEFCVLRNLTSNHVPMTHVSATEYRVCTVVT